MGRQLLGGTLTMNALLVLSIFVSLSLGQASAECPAPTIGNCSATDYRCDLGFNAGCWMGSFCMPEGSICPMICNTPAPSNCTAAETVCDMGSYGGCWRGDYCMPNGTVCPPVCNSPAPSTVAREKLSATWDHMRDAGRATSASQRVQSVLMSATTPLLLNVWSQKFSATWGLLKAVGMATTARLMEQSVLQCVTTLFPPNVWLEKSPVTWDIMLGAGWEISAMRIRMDSSVLQFATGPLTLYVRMTRFCATWVLMPITAGWEITACLRAPNVQPLQEFDQTSDVSIKIYH